LIAEVSDDVHVVNGIEHFDEFQKVGVRIDEFQYADFVLDHGEKDRVGDTLQVDDLGLCGILYLDCHLLFGHAMVAFEDLAELASADDLVRIVDVVLDLLLRMINVMMHTYIVVGICDCAGLYIAEFIN
jgi:hypothetical protein